jgi:hypothetical protein
MAIEDILIKASVNKIIPHDKKSFPKDCVYESSDGLRFRSEIERDWHEILLNAGIPHVYEPKIKGIRSRPDFGIPNNFLVEICGMVEGYAPKEGECDRRRSYKIRMHKKRIILPKLGYNLIEIYGEELTRDGCKIIRHKELIINSTKIKTKSIVNSVTSILLNHSDIPYFQKTL